MASDRSSLSSVVAVSASAMAMPTLSPGERVIFRMDFSIALRMAWAKYLLG
jgi:hypothetical protein